MAKKVLSEAQLEVLRLGQALFRIEGAAGNLRALDMNKLPVPAIVNVLDAIGCLEAATSFLRSWNVQRHKALGGK